MQRLSARSPKDLGIAWASVSPVPIVSGVVSEARQQAVIELYRMAIRARIDRYSPRSTADQTMLPSGASGRASVPIDAFPTLFASAGKIDSEVSIGRAVRTEFHASLNGTSLNETSLTHLSMRHLSMGELTLAIRRERANDLISQNRSIIFSSYAQSTLHPAYPVAAERPPCSYEFNASWPSIRPCVDPRGTRVARGGCVARDDVPYGTQ